MRKNLLAAVIFAGTIAAWGQTPPLTIKTMAIESHWGGLGTPAESNLTITKTATGYKTAKVSLEPMELEALTYALSEPAIAEPNAANLGIDHAWLVARADKANDMSSLTTVGRTESEKQRQFFRRAFLDETQLPARLKQIYEGFHTDDYPSIHIKITQEDGSVVTVDSHSQHPYMIPWIITRNGVKQETFNAHISFALQALMPKDFANRTRLANDDKYSDGLLGELAMHMGWDLRTRWDEIGAEESAGDSLAILKKDFVIKHSEISPYHDFYFGKSWDGGEPHEENLHVDLHDPELPANVVIGAILLRENGRVQDLSDVPSRIRTDEKLLLSIPWLTKFFKEHPKENAWLIFVHDRSLSPKAMKVFEGDMKAARHPELIGRVEADQERAVLLETGAGDFWILLPDHSVVLWRRASLRPILKWPYKTFEEHECSEYGIVTGGCVGAVINPEGDLTR